MGEGGLGVPIVECDVSPWATRVLAVSLQRPHSLSVWNRLTSRGHYTFDEIIIFSRNLILLWTGFEKVCYWFSDIPLRQRVCIPYTGLFRNVRSVYSLYHAVEVKPVIHLGPVSIEKSHPRVTHLSWTSQLFIHFLTKSVERRNRKLSLQEGWSA